MEHTIRDGKRVCIGFDKEYSKYVCGEKSKIFREILGYRGEPTLYSVLDTTGGMFSCTSNGVLPSFSWRGW